MESVLGLSIVARTSTFIIAEKMEKIPKTGKPRLKVT